MRESPAIICVSPGDGTGRVEILFTKLKDAQEYYRQLVTPTPQGEVANLIAEARHLAKLDDIPDDDPWAYIEIVDGLLLGLADALERSEREQLDALKLLNPNSPEETLGGAIRNLQQAHLSEAGNVEELEQERDTLARQNEAQMLQLKACEHIAEGLEGWERLRNECPSTMEVAVLRDERDTLKAELEQSKRDRLDDLANQHTVLKQERDALAKAIETALSWLNGRKALVNCEPLYPILRPLIEKEKV